MKKKNIILTICLALSLSIAGLNGCDTEQTTEQAAEVATAENAANVQSESRDTVAGPVKANVTLTPSSPTLGDQVTLTLTVHAPNQVTVHMPAFGEQLGRFSIVEFKPSQKLEEDGSTTQIQAYTLDLPMSGKLRIPSLLVEFEDHRPDSEYGNKVQELLTEEFSFNVTSVLPENEIVSELAPPMPALPELVLPEDNKVSVGTIVAACCAFIAILAALVIFSRKKAKQIIIPPHEIALKALDELENEPYPKEMEGIDQWFVKLSGILRQYIEARFALNAPCQTTEEFFALANQSSALSQEQKLSLRRILEKSDRVKFATYLPEQKESLDALHDTRRFVEETRPILENT